MPDSTSDDNSQNAPEPLQADVLAQLREKLYLLQHELHALIAHEAESGSTVELDQSRVGRLSRIDALAGAEMNKDAARRRRLQLKQIKAALQKMDLGSYGDCDECLEPINPQRLALNPALALCVDCAARLEIQ